MKKKKCLKAFFAAAILDHFSKNVKIWDHFFSLLFPKDFEYLKNLDIGLWEMVAKRLLNGVRKCDGLTDKQTNIQAFQLIERIGPEGRFFENAGSLL